MGWAHRVGCRGRSARSSGGTTSKFRQRSEARFELSQAALSLCRTTLHAQRVHSYKAVYALSNRLVDGVGDPP